MKRLLVFFLICSITTTCKAQQYSSSAIFAHNDYVRPQPFYTAFNLRVGFIEADVFLAADELMVAHHQHEITNGRTLDSLYLKPLAEQIRKNKGSIYPDTILNLTLMVDLKTEGTSTLRKLVKAIEKYPELGSCPSLQIMISGNVPAPDTWDEYPSFIYFDGRPGIVYTPSQLKRVSMISTNFQSHVKWDGKNMLSQADRSKIQALVNEVHAKGKKVRFWATPDFEDAWSELITLNMDVIVTDDVTRLATFLEKRNR